MGYPGSWLRESDPHRGFHWSLERGSPPDRPEHSLCRYHHKERSRFVLFFLVSTSQTQSIGSWSSTTSCTFFSLCHPHPQHKHNRPRDSRSDGQRRLSRGSSRRRFLHLSSFPPPSTADSLETLYSHGCFLALAVNRSLYIYNSLIDHLWLLHGVLALLALSL